MKARTLFLASPFLLWVAVAQPAEQTVEISNFAFSPSELTVGSGATVTWINHDQEPHRVVGKDNTFHSAALDTDERYSYTFARPGIYPYFCSVHPNMTGTITVIGSH